MWIDVHQTLADALQWLTVYQEAGAATASGEDVFVAHQSVGADNGAIEFSLGFDGLWGRKGLEHMPGNYIVK